MFGLTPKQYGTCRFCNQMVRWLFKEFDLSMNVHVLQTGVAIRQGRESS